MTRTRFRDRGVVLALTGVLALLVAPATVSAQAPAIETVDVTGAEALGLDGAPATLVIFADLGGTSAAGLGVILRGLVERYPQTLKVYFRHAPAADQPEHTLAHLAALAAGEQGKFWEMLDLLLANQSRHGREHLLSMAAQLELDVARFSEAIDNASGEPRLTSDRQQATLLRVAASPTFFVNGVRLPGRKTLVELTAQIDAAIAASPSAWR